MSVRTRSDLSGLGQRLDQADASLTVEPRRNAMPTSDINTDGATSDPFAYTLGSLMTPWTKQFAAPTPAAAAPGAANEGLDGQVEGPGGSGAPAAPPKFEFGDFSFNVGGPGWYTAPDKFATPEAFKGERMAGVDPFTGGRINASARFQSPVQPFDMGEWKTPEAFQPTTGFSAERMSGLPAYQGPGEFAAPNFNDPNDPAAQAYKFRLDQGQQMLENSAAAKGVLRTGGTMKDLINYGQGAASQEYQSAWDRAMQQYQTEAQLGLAGHQMQMDQAFGTYDRNYNAGLAENEIAYGRAASEYDRNLGMNERAWERNFDAGMAQNREAYGRYASEYDREEANRRAIDEINYARGASEYDRNLQNSRSADQINYERAAGEYDRNFGNAWNVYQGNSAQALDAYRANTESQMGMGRLGLDAAMATYDRNYEKSLTAYQMAEQARMAAMMGSGGGGGGGGGGGLSDTQLYNRAMNEYEMNYNIFRNNQNDQFGRLVTLAQLGQGSAGMLGGYGSNYAANGGNTMMGMGNAAAGGIVGAQNAWNQGLSGAGNSAMDAAMAFALNGGGQQAPTFGWES
jgi:hypothetical protein